MKNKVYSSFACLLIVSLLLAACAPVPAAAPNCASAEDFCVGLVAQTGKIDDHSLNQMAWEGVKRAELRLGVYVQYIETVDSRDYEKNIATFANAGYDLIVTVGYNQKKATIDTAIRYPQINFIGVDQPLDPDKALPQNMVGLMFAEDQLGFLAGALAAQMSKTHKVGAVCGPDTYPPAWRYCEGYKAGVGYINSPPVDEPPDDGEPPNGGEPTPTEEPSEEPTEESTQAQLIAAKNFPARKPLAQETVTATPTPRVAPRQAEPTGIPIIPVEALVSHHNEVAFSDNLADPEWDALTADRLIALEADVIFGADSYDENGAASAAAKRRVYAIGVNIDQYFTVPDARDGLLTSVVKQVAGGVFDLIRHAKNGKFPAGAFLGAVGYAPYHDLSGRVPAAVTEKLVEIQAGLANGSIETGVPPTKP